MVFIDASRAFSHFWQHILERGESFQNTRALFNQSFTIDKPELREIISPIRKFNSSYAEHEWDWYMSGNRSVEEIKKRAQMWDKMHHGDNLVWSNYGYWWKRNDQLKKVINLIRENNQTRRAVVVHYNVDDIDNYDKDTPCNIVLNFYVLSGYLYMTVFARSIDLWYGFCNDQYIFSKLLEKTAVELNLHMGTLHFFITNLHVYKNKL